MRRRGRALSALPEFPGLTFEFMRSAMPTSYDGVFLSVDKGSKHVGELTVTKCNAEGYASVDEAWIADKWRGKGLYPVMLTKMRDHVKAKGCKGLVSRRIGRRGTKSTASWERFAAREPRVRAVETEYGPDYYLDGLPARGRIRIEATDFGWEAFDSTGKSVGYININKNIPAVTEVESYGNRGDRIGTKLYEAAARHYCAQTAYSLWGGEPLGPRVLQSDTSRSGESENFWYKQYKKGRAVFCWRSAEDESCDDPPFIESGENDPEGMESWYKLKPEVCKQKRLSLAGLPAHGRIPLATVKRALSKLPKSRRACGFTTAELREGMEVEREHRDVTGGRVGTTAKIAAAHLCERRDYYRRLKRFVE